MTKSQQSFRQSPVIQDALAILRKEEVITPSALANKVLDLLPITIWSNPSSRFLNPCSKSGIFLREIAIRLMFGLSDEIPNEQRRREHIFGNMIYGIATSKLSGLMTRRTLYYSKDASSKYSVVKFDSESGNVYYEQSIHTFDKNRRCIYCGKKDFNCFDSENDAYLFLHKPLKEIFDTDFDVIIGHPPYQMNSAGRNGTIQIYKHFVSLSKELAPKYIALIIPSNGMISADGQKKLRNNLLSDVRMKNLVIHDSTEEILQGFQILERLCYFLWDRGYSGSCSVDYSIGEKD